MSVSTVSRSLNDNPRISATTRERIKGLAKELDFEFNASARSLSTRRSGTVAFVVPAFLDQFANTLYLNLLIYDIRENLAARGIDCILTEATTREGASNVRRLVLQRKVDGIILLLESNRPEDWSLIKKRDIPVIHVHYMPTYFDTERLYYYFTDNVAGGRMATEALLASGCRRLACLMDVCRNPEMEDRERGFVEAHRARGLSVDSRLLLSVENSFKSAYEAAKSSRGLLDACDGIFVTTDVMALGVLRALQDEGRRVPEDFRIVGYDDLELCTYVRPTLSSVHQPHEEISRLACERLLRLLGGEGRDEVEQRLIAPTFVGRESC